VIVREGNFINAFQTPRFAAAIVVGGRPHKAAVSGLAGSIGAALVHRFHGSVLIVRGDDSAWNPSSASGPVLPAVSPQPVSSAD